MLDEQVVGCSSNGGIDFAAAGAPNLRRLYGWAESRDWASPFVTDPSMRSNVIGTIDLDDSIDATMVARCCGQRHRRHEPYRKLGRNQLRIAMFPAIDPSDVRRSPAAIDHVVEALS
jgi:phosphoserine aminotransferase